MSNLDMTMKDTGSEFQVSARALHEWLEVTKPFAAWFAYQISRGPNKTQLFFEGRDYIAIIDKIVHNSAGRPAQDYMLTLRAAQHIGMMSNTIRGVAARDYFIDCELKLRSLQQPMDELEMIAAMIKSQLEQRASMKVLEASVDTLADEVRAIKAASHIEDGYVTISGFLSLIGVKNKTPNEIKILGMQVAKYCKENGVSIAQVPSAKYGKVNAYPKEVLEMLIGDAA